MSKPQFTREIPNARSSRRPTEALTVEGNTILEVTKAIGSDTRWDIITALAADTRTIQELTDYTGLSKGTVSAHVQQLESAEIVASRFNVSDNGGVEKEIGLAVDEVTLNLSGQ